MQMTSAQLSISSPSDKLQYLNSAKFCVPICYEQLLPLFILLMEEINDASKVCERTLVIWTSSNKLLQIVE